VGALLGCFGDLFRAEFAPRWPSDAELAAAASAAASQQQPAPPPPPVRGAVTVASNDVTRARLDLECAALESALAPRAATRLLHAFCVAVAHKFWGSTGKRLAKLEALFFHLEQYLGKDALDLSVSLSARAEAAEGDKLKLQVSGLPSGGGGDGSRGREEKASGGGGATAAAAAAVRLVNDVDLMTVLDTVQLLASAG
jgi:hypothetical protein